jgi:hypothetical protein
MTFPIQASPRQKATTVVLATALPMVLLAGAIAAQLVRSSTPWFMWVLIVLVTVGIAFSYARLSVEISLTDGDSLECRSLLGRVSVPVAAITEIDARSWNRGIIFIKSPGTTVHLYRAMPGALGALRELADRSPSIKFRE